MFPNKTLYKPLLSPHTCHLPRPSHPSYLNTRIIFGKECRSWSSWLCSLLQSLITSLLLDPNRQGFISEFFRTFLVCSKGLATGRSPHKEASQQPFSNAMSEIYHPSDESDDAVLRVDTVSIETIMCYVPVGDSIHNNMLWYYFIFYIWVSVHHKSIIYNKTTRCISGRFVFINNYRYALHVSDTLCVHQEHYKL